MNVRDFTGGKDGSHRRSCQTAFMVIPIKFNKSLVFLVGAVDKSKNNSDICNLEENERVEFCERNS